MPRAYRYVGPRDIADRASAAAPGTVVASADDVIAWVMSAGPAHDRITATFVVDTAGRLRLADRHSEHVACAGGGPVLAAGEVTLCIRAGRVSVEEVSNQSTGYCPEPESWTAVAAALVELGVPAPEGYTTELLFRRCPCCGQINVVKDSAFECAVCGSALPLAWNLEAVADGRVRCTVESQGPSSVMTAAGEPVPRRADRTTLGWRSSGARIAGQIVA